MKPLLAVGKLPYIDVHTCRTDSEKSAAPLKSGSNK